MVGTSLGTTVGETLGRDDGISLLKVGAELVLLGASDVMVGLALGKELVES